MLYGNAKHSIRNLLALEKTHIGEKGGQQVLHQTVNILLIARKGGKDLHEHWLAFAKTLLMNQLTHFVNLLQQKILIQNIFFWVIRLF